MLPPSLTSWLRHRVKTNMAEPRGHQSTNSLLRELSIWSIRRGGGSGNGSDRADFHHRSRNDFGGSKVSTQFLWCIWFETHRRRISPQA